MTAATWGRLDLRGGVDSLDVSAGRDQLALIVSRWGEHSTAVALRVGPGGPPLEKTWSRTLPQRPYHVYQSPAGGRSEFLPTPSVLAGNDGLVYLVSGCDRLAVELDSGEVVASAQSEVSPSAPAALIGAQLIVPEGHELAAYDADTLAPAWRRRAPRNLWCQAPPASGVCVVCRPIGRAKQDRQVVLWSYEDGSLWTLPDATLATGAPVEAGSVMAVGSGAGGGDRLSALELGSGAVKWEAHSPARGLFGPHLDVPGLPHPALISGELIIWANQVPSVEGRVAATGELLWRVELHDQPSALSLIDGTAWVGTSDGTVVAIEARTGARLRAGKIGSPEDGVLVSVVSLRGKGGPASVLVLGLGAFYEISADGLPD